MNSAVIVSQSSLGIAETYTVGRMKGQFCCGRIPGEHLSKQDNSGEIGNIVISPCCQERTRLINYEMDQYIQCHLYKITRWMGLNEQNGKWNPVRHSSCTRPELSEKVDNKERCVWRPALECISTRHCSYFCLEIADISSFECIHLSVPS